jgi:indole-3-glycerol phosphate synthase
MSFLEEILASTRQAVEERQKRRSLDDLVSSLQARPDDRSFLEALRKPGMSVIAEFKRNSPSQTDVDNSANLSEVVGDYERGRASAISVLTEETEFHGSLDDLKDARNACRLPILRKDFIIDEYQIYEAAALEVDAVLLIAAAFDKDPLRLEALYDTARGLSLDVLIEVRNQPELDLALGITDELVGINNRDLDTLKIEPSTTRILAAEVPRNTTIVSESGIKTPVGLESLAHEVRLDAALIGTALMQAGAAREALCRDFSSVAEDGNAASGRPGSSAVLAA